MKRILHPAVAAAMLAAGWLAALLPAQTARFNYTAGARQAARQGTGVQAATSVRGGFSPAAITGLDLWLDAAQLSGLSDGASFATWPDGSGNARSAGQANGGQRPVYQAGAGPNGTPCVRFDGVDDFMDIPAFSTFPSKRGTILVVIKCSFASGYRVPLSTYNGVGVGWQIESNITGTKYKWYDNVGDRLAANSDSSSAFELQSFRRTADAALEFKRNATLESTLTIADNQPDAKVLQVGGFSNAAGSNCFHGDIALVLIYSRSLSSVELAQLESWINQRFTLY